MHLLNDWTAVNWYLDKTNLHIAKYLNCHQSLLLQDYSILLLFACIFYSVLKVLQSFVIIMRFCLACLHCTADYFVPFFTVSLLDRTDQFMPGGVALNLSTCVQNFCLSSSCSPPPVSFFAGAQQTSGTMGAGIDTYYSLYLGRHYYFRPHIFPTAHPCPGTYTSPFTVSIFKLGAHELSNQWSV